MITILSGLAAGAAHVWAGPDHLAAIAIGLLHGLAGSAHFFGVLPMLALPTRTMAALYLLAFSLGTIASRAAFSGLVGLSATRFASRDPQLYRAFISLCSLAAVAVGVCWLLP